MRADLFTVAFGDEAAAVGRNGDPFEPDIVVRRGGAEGIDDEGDRGAVVEEHPEHRRLHGEARVDVADREDRPVVVAAVEWVAAVAPAATSVLGDDRGVGVGGLPLAPCADRDRVLIEYDAGVLQRPADGFAGERVEDR